MRIPLFRVNAFARQPFAGNPAAVCPLDWWLDETKMRKVASEINLSATAFFVAGDGHYAIRWFTPRCEIRLCGHATLASAYVVLHVLRPGLEFVRFETHFGGPLIVRKDGHLLSMDFPALFPTVCEKPPEGLARGLGSGPQWSTVLTVNDTYITVYETEAAVRNLRPDFVRLEQLHPFAVAVTAPGEESDFVSRYFAPSYGVPEDSVTGSVHCALTPYWIKRLGKAVLHARQLSERGGELWCEMAGERVILKGSAVLNMQGFLEI